MNMLRLKIPHWKTSISQNGLRAYRHPFLPSRFLGASSTHEFLLYWQIEACSMQYYVKETKKIETEKRQRKLVEIMLFPILY